MLLSSKGSVTNWIGQGIAGKLGYERVTVQRKLRLIRQIWGQEASP
jgi:hypothetical protein